jgi:uncharacterized protein
MIRMNQIIALANRVAAQFSPHKIILFGSYAYGTPQDGSDVDLLVITEFRGDAFDCATRMLETLQPEFSVDVLVRRPADAARRYRQFDPLIREALDRGKVLYERNGTRVGGQSRRGLRQRPARSARSKVA